VQHLHSADKSSTFTQRIAHLNISLIGLVPEITSDGLCAQRLVQRSYYEHNYPGDYRSEHDRESRQDPGGLRDQNVLHIPEHIGRDVSLGVMSEEHAD
jgi:hypothetical protein